MNKGKSREELKILYQRKCEHSPVPSHSRNERQAYLDIHFSLLWGQRLQKTSHRDVFCGATQRATLAELIIRSPRGASGTCNHPFARFIRCDNSIRRSRANFLSFAGRMTRWFQVFFVSKKEQGDLHHLVLFWLRRWDLNHTASGL